MPTPRTTITTRITFSAAHQLQDPTLSEEENRRVFGSCYDLHGHNYVLEVTVAGESELRNGMVMNFRDLKHVLHEEIHAEVDHRFLNDVPFLEGCVTTAENLARAFWRRLEPRVNAQEGCRLDRVRLHETEDSYAECTGGTE